MEAELEEKRREQERKHEERMMRMMMGCMQQIMNHFPLFPPTSPIPNYSNSHMNYSFMQPHDEDVHNY